MTNHVVNRVHRIRVVRSHVFVQNLRFEDPISGFVERNTIFVVIEFSYKGYNRPLDSAYRETRWPTFWPKPL